MTKIRRSAWMTAPWNGFAQNAMFLMDCQIVISLRLMKIAAGGPAAAGEVTRMVVEKFSTFADAQWDAAAAFPAGGLAGATAAAQRRYRRRVAANRRRLSP